jgi:hypothetical protein
VGDVVSSLLGGLLFFGMLALTAYGWRTVPADARFRARMGPTGIDGSMGKRTALLTWPAIGLFVLFFTLTTQADWLGVVLLAWLLVMQFVSVRSTIGGG